MSVSSERRAGRCYLSLQARATLAPALLAGLVDLTALVYRPEAAQNEGGARVAREAVHERRSLRCARDHAGQGSCMTREALALRARPCLAGVVHDKGGARAAREALQGHVWSEGALALRARP